jgi:hypothetical protein
MWENLAAEPAMCRFLLRESRSKVLPYSLIKEFRKFYKLSQAWDTKPHSRGIIEPKFFAPAKLQRAASPLIFVTMIVGNVAMFWNTLALRLFQISHETSMMRVTRDFLRTPLEYMKLIHHSFTVSFFSQNKKVAVNIRARRYPGCGRIS